MMDDTEQPTISPKTRVQIIENKEKNVVEKPIQESLCPETSYTNENLEKLSDVLKTIASKNKIVN